MTKIDVNITKLENSPLCPHGPTLLFTRHNKNGSKSKFYACSAYRDRKFCKFFISEDDLKKQTERKKEVWKREASEYALGINLKLTRSKRKDLEKLPPSDRIYCHDCSKLESIEFILQHSNHNVKKGVSDVQMKRPTEFLLPLENAKKEAQYLFSETSTLEIVEIFKKLKLTNVLCIGTPRIYEHILNERKNMKALLLDFDQRFINFFEPDQFCLYNMFNNYFFFDDGKRTFENFLRNARQTIVLIIDPPFGGRVEPLAETLKTINKFYKTLCGTKQDLPIFWIFPYFMEPHILNFMENFSMLDYKVNYDNHPLFQRGPKGRKGGSPVRIFTNLDPCKIVLPSESGYKHCRSCKKWVSNENIHCNKCNDCTSKNGQTYVHCDICNRCVKPQWVHCYECARCAQSEHKCQILKFSGECLSCGEVGHKSKECSKEINSGLKRKRKDLNKEKKRKNLKKNKIM